LSLQEPATLGETYIVADPTPLTLAEIIAALRAGEGRTPRLLPMPPPLVSWALKAVGRTEMWERLGGALIADSSKLLHAGWKPVVETRAGLAEMVQATSPRKSGTASRSTR
jgi:UDP-glucose 4-epimerase